MMQNYSLTFLLLLSIHLVSAQQSQKISIKEAFDLATQASKQLQTDDLKKQALEIKKKQTQNAMLPVLGVNSSYSRISNNIDPFKIGLPGLGEFTLNPIILNQYNNRFYIQQPFFSGLRNWNTLKALKFQQAAADFDIQKDKEDAKWNVAQAYYTLFKLRQTNKLLDSSIAQTQARVQDVSRFKNAGLALNNDVMRAELQKTNLLVNKADVESAIEITNFNLCLLLGLDTKINIDVEGPETFIFETSSVDELMNGSFSNRAELKAQEARTQAANYAIRASKSAYMPTLSFITDGYVNNPNQRVFPQEAKFKATWDIGVSMNWNIMQLYTARAIVSESANQKAQLQKITDQLKEGVQMEVNANYEALKVALLKIELAKKAVEQSAENKRILGNRFAAQVALLTDVLEADQLLLQAETQLLNAQADAAMANYKLQKSTGGIK